MKKLWTVLLMIFLLSSCSKPSRVESDKTQENIPFLTQHGVLLDSERPHYNSEGIVPEVFDTVWNMRDTFSQDLFKKSISQYKGKQYIIYMYPVADLPKTIEPDIIPNARAVVISIKGSIICSYIEFISESKNLPAASLSGVLIDDLSGLKWDIWRNRIDDDDNKKLVIWKYYESLRYQDFETAYSFIYDKASIKKDDFIDAAKKSRIAYLDFLDISQYKKPTDNECFFLVKAKVENNQKQGPKIYDITFDLKRSSEEDYGGWKIYATKLK